MKEKKRLLLRAVLIVLALALLCAGAFGAYLLYRFTCDRSGGAFDYEAVYSRPASVLDVGEDGKFTVLKINDTHFVNGVCEEDRQTLDFLERVLQSASFDLIVADGDLLEGFTLRRDYDKFRALSFFAQLVEKTGVPWTFAPGNNDGEIDGPDAAIIAFLTQYPHFLCGNARGVYGDMQFFIDLTYRGERVHTLAVLDSGMRRPPAFGKYESMRQSQIDWLLAGVNGRAVPASVFFHMPTPAFEAAFDEGEAYPGFTMYKTTPYLDVPGNALFDEQTAGNEWITLLSCAHQHSNNMCAFYEGRWYQLSSVSGYGAGRNDFITPCVTLTTIDVTQENPKEMYAFRQISE